MSANPLFNNARRLFRAQGPVQLGELQEFDFTMLEVGRKVFEAAGHADEHRMEGLAKLGSSSKEDFEEMVTYVKNNVPEMYVGHAMAAYLAPYGCPAQDVVTGLEEYGISKDETMPSAENDDPIRGGIELLGVENFSPVVFDARDALELMSDDSLRQILESKGEMHPQSSEALMGMLEIVRQYDAVVDLTLNAATLCDEQGADGRVHCMVHIDELQAHISRSGRLPSLEGWYTFEQMTTATKWEERDRLHISLVFRDPETMAADPNLGVLMDFWDDDARALVEDGLIDPQNLHKSLLEYGRELGVFTAEHMAKASELYDKAYPDEEMEDDSSSNME